MNASHYDIKTKGIVITAIARACYIPTQRYILVQPRPVHKITRNIHKYPPKHASCNAPSNKLNPRKVPLSEVGVNPLKKDNLKATSKYESQKCKTKKPEALFLPDQRMALLARICKASTWKTGGDSMAYPVSFENSVEEPRFSPMISLIYAKNITPSRVSNDTLL